MEISEETPIAALTVSQFVRILERRKTQEPQPSTDTPKTSKRYAYGLKGIQKLFNVCPSTASTYKKTFLKPAIMQNGRKIVVDIEKALELFDEHNK